LALYTPLPLPAAQAVGQRFGKTVVAVTGIRGGSVNSGYRLDLDDGNRLFARIYEEQDEAGARRDVALARGLVKCGVPTPEPLLTPGGEGIVLLGDSAEKKAVALVPWAAGEMRCQASVVPEDLHQVGVALAKFHAATPKLPATSPSRFDLEGLLGRCDTIANGPDEVLSSWADPLRAWLKEVSARRVTESPRGVIHGDVFRDNVLFDGPRLTAILDFESASEGPFTFDLAVTLLAWCFGDDFEPKLARALLGGYQSVRKLDENERRGLFYEAHFGTLRFATTRITDYAMRAGDGTNVTKDYRRFLFRMGRLRKLGPRAFRTALGL
jgi:homoserine kinase type II